MFKSARESMILDLIPIVDQLYGLALPCKHPITVYTRRTIDRYHFRLHPLKIPFVRKIQLRRAKAIATTLFASITKKYFYGVPMTIPPSERSGQRAFSIRVYITIWRSQRRPISMRHSHFSEIGT